MKGVWFLFALSMMVPVILAQASEPEKREMKPALIVIDIQNRYLPMMAQDEKAVISFL